MDYCALGLHFVDFFVVFSRIYLSHCFLLIYLGFPQIVDAEWTILYDKLKKIHESGAKIVLSKLPIGDVATQWFADRYVALCFKLLV